jgi:hypothetical protein
MKYVKMRNMGKTFFSKRDWKNTNPKEEASGTLNPKPFPEWPRNKYDQFTDTVSWSNRNIHTLSGWGIIATAELNITSSSILSSLILQSKQHQQSELRV